MKKLLFALIPLAIFACENPANFRKEPENNPVPIIKREVSIASLQAVQLVSTTGGKYTLQAAEYNTGNEVKAEYYWVKDNNRSANELRGQGFLVRVENTSNIFEWCHLYVDVKSVYSIHLVRDGKTIYPHGK